MTIHSSEVPLTVEDICGPIWQADPPYASTAEVQRALQKSAALLIQASPLVQELARTEIVAHLRYHNRCGVHSARRILREAEREANRAAEGSK
jgi:hypothetical protein